MDRLPHAARGEFLPDPWLAETMGRPVFRLAQRDFTGQQSALRSSMQQLAGRGDAFFYAKVPASDVAACITLSNIGFAVVDTGITFSWSGPGRDGPSVVSCGIARPDQLEAIPRIAETCFRWSRFHLDPKIPPALANQVKRMWMQSYVEGKRGAALYAAESSGIVLGFLGVVHSSVDGRQIAIIDLIGVTPSYQAKGVGIALVRAFVQDWRGRVAELRVGTQAANIQSLRFYQSNGFRIVDSTYVLHAHYRNGEIYW